MLTVIMLVITLNVIYADCCYACYYAERRLRLVSFLLSVANTNKPFMMSVVMLYVIMASLIMLNVLMLNVIMVSVIYT
jgi:hypothetical protein